LVCLSNDVLKRLRLNPWPARRRSWWPLRCPGSLYNVEHRSGARILAWPVTRVPASTPPNARGARPAVALPVDCLNRQMCTARSKPGAEAQFLLRAGGLWISNGPDAGIGGTRQESGVGSGLARILRGFRHVVVRPNDPPNPRMRPGRFAEGITYVESDSPCPGLSDVISLHVP